MCKVNNYFYLRAYLTPFSSVSIVEFEQQSVLGVVVTFVDLLNIFKNYVILSET